MNTPFDDDARIRINSQFNSITTPWPPLKINRHSYRKSAFPSNTNNGQSDHSHHPQHYYHQSTHIEWLLPIKETPSFHHYLLNCIYLSTRAAVTKLMVVTVTEPRYVDHPRACTISLSTTIISYSKASSPPMPLLMIIIDTRPKLELQRSTSFYSKPFRLDGRMEYSISK